MVCLLIVYGLCCPDASSALGSVVGASAPGPARQADRGAGEPGEQRAALAALAGSRDRGEADRARAVLLTLAGWSSPRIAEAFGGREDTVRLWRSNFAAGGVAALKASIAPRAWAKSGADLRVPAPGQAKKVAMLGSLDHVTRQLIVHTSPTKRSSDFIAHLEQLDRLFGPQPGRQAKPVVLVEDDGPIHTSKLSLAALAARAHWLRTVTVSASRTRHGCRLPPS